EHPMTFTIYADKLPEVTKRLERLAKKAARYSVPFAYSIGDEHPQTVTTYGIDHITSTKYETGRYTVAAVDVEIECEQFIKANGWTLRAKCEHGDQGNVVSAIGLKPIEKAWFTAPARCDHCKTNRFRAVTYFVENTSGEVRQVGRGCLHEYTGINPAAAALWADVNDVLNDDFDLSDNEWGARGLDPMYDVTTVFAHAYDAIKAFGYRKSGDNGSTKDEVIDRVLSGKEPSAEALNQAEKIKAWLLSLEEVVRNEDEARAAAYAESEANADEYGIPAPVRHTPNTVSDLERNCISMARGGYIKVKHFGRLAYMPVAYEKYLERKAREEARRAAAAAETRSEHVGSIGDRITVKAATAKLLTSWENAYGVTYLYKFTDESGNVFIWYASRGIEVEDGMTLKGTVKDHNERDGVKQTVITRCKIA
ncbi:MAG: hypothetical protein ACI4SV_05405, partial [Duodenibacillus sp.]